MKPDRSAFAIEGGPSSFDEPVPFGQLRAPDAAGFRAVLQRLEDNGYYTNHGPLAREFERRLAELLGVEHVVACTNEGLALTMFLRGSVPEGRVLVPAVGPPELVEAALWGRHRPAFYDLDLGALEDALTPDTTGIVAHDPMGTSLDPVAVIELAARRGLPVVVHAPGGLGSTYAGRAVPAPEHATVFSFHASRVVSTQEGGCVATDDADLAATLRNMRSSYGAGAPAQVPVTANGRFSELQAGLGLWGLDQLPRSLDHNRTLEAAYLEVLAGATGLCVAPADAARCVESLLLRVDPGAFGVDASTLARVLVAEGVEVQRLADRFLPARFAELLGDSGAFPLAAALAEEGVLLPMGAGLSPDGATRIARLVLDVGRCFGDG